MAQKVELGAGLPGEGHEGGTQDNGQPLVPTSEALHSHVWQPVPTLPVGLCNTQCKQLTGSRCSLQLTHAGAVKLTANTGLSTGSYSGLCIYLPLGGGACNEWMNNTVQPVVTQTGISQLAQYSQQYACHKKEQTAQAADLITQHAPDAEHINAALGFSPLHCGTGHWLDQRGLYDSRQTG